MQPIETSPRGTHDDARAPCDETTAVIAESSDGPAHAIGSTVSRYVVLEEIGRGAMGRVLRAYDPKLQREVALKEVRAATTPEGTQRLVAEARAMAKLSHPNVVAVYDVEQLPPHDDGEDARVVLVMEYVAGATLQVWLASRPPWREIVLRFVDAGHGLAAAHAVGVLHRDFKPANVLMGTRESDVVVKVTDFGLAKLHTGAPSSNPAASASARISSELLDELSPTPTRTGVVLGSPRYMAPEQHLGDTLGPAADQFAFCVALWEALAGTPPFVGNTLVALAQAKQLGPPPFPRAAIPRGVVAALRRGLAADPDARHGSIDALLGALTRAPARARRRRLLAVGATTVAMAALAGQRWAAAEPAPCTDTAARMSGVWDDATRQAVHDAMLAVDASYAAPAWAHASAALDRYAGAWIEMHHETCAATEIRGEQSVEILHLKMSCLHRARLELQAVTGALAQADAVTVRAAHRSVGGLRPLARCDDIEALAHDVPPPSSADAEAVERARVELAGARAADAAGHYALARERIDAAERELAETAYAPIRTELMIERGDVLLSLAELDPAEHALRAGLEQGMRLQQWDEVFRATMLLMDLVGKERQRPDEALRYREIAVALAGDDPAKQAQLASNVALVMMMQGKYADAEVEARRSLALREALLGPDHLDVATSRNRLAAALLEQGKTAEAGLEFRKILELRLALLGPAHPTVGNARGNLAEVLAREDRYPEAEAEQRQSLAIEEAAMGAEHPAVAAAHGNLANMLDAQGKRSEALAEYRRALAIEEAALGPDHPGVAFTLHHMASTLEHAGEQAEAEAVQRRALAIRVQRLGADHPLTGESHADLGITLQRQRRYAEAEAAYRLALEVLEAALDPSHVDIATTRGNLGRLLYLQGRPADAELEQRRALASLVASLGPEHRVTTVARHNLALTLWGAGAREEGEAELRSAVLAWEHTRGPELPEAAATRADLADILLGLGRHDEALALAERAWSRNARDDIEPADRAESAFVLARALRATGGAGTRARELAEQARAEYLKAERHDEARAITAWLRQR